MPKVFLKNNYKYLVIFTLLFLGVLVYSNTFLSPFHFDDELSIVKNIAIRNIRDISLSVFRPELLSG